MKCVYCGSSGRIMGQATISAPGELAHQFSKSNLRRKDVYLMGVNWETFDFICGNPACGRVRDGYGNYISKLVKKMNSIRETAQAISKETLEQLPPNVSDFIMKVAENDKN